MPKDTIVRSLTVAPAKHLRLTGDKSHLFIQPEALIVTIHSLTRGCGFADDSAAL